MTLPDTRHVGILFFASIVRFFFFSFFLFSRCTGFVVFSNYYFSSLLLPRLAHRGAGRSSGPCLLFPHVFSFRVAAGKDCFGKAILMNLHVDMSIVIRRSSVLSLIGSLNMIEPFLIHPSTFIL